MSTNFNAEFINKHSKTILLILYCHYIVFGKKHKNVKYTINNIAGVTGTASTLNVEKKVYLFDTFGLYRNMSSKLNTGDTMRPTLIDESKHTKKYVDGVFVLSSIPIDDSLKEINSRTTKDRDTSFAELAVTNKSPVYQVGNIPTTFSQNLDYKHSFRIDSNITKLSSKIKNSSDKLDSKLIEKLLSKDIDLQTTNGIKYPFSELNQNIPFISLFMLFEAFTDVIIENLNLVILVGYILHKVQENDLASLPVNIQYIALMFTLSIISVLPKNMTLLDSIFSINPLLQILLEERVFLKRSNLDRTSQDYNIRKQNLNLFSQSSKDKEKFKDICKYLFTLNDEENQILVSLAEQFGINLPNESFNAMREYNISQFIVYDNSNKYDTIISTGKLISRYDISTLTVPNPSTGTARRPKAITNCVANSNYGSDSRGPIWRYGGKNDFAFLPWDDDGRNGINYLKTAPATDATANVYRSVITSPINPSITDVSVKFAAAAAATTPPTVPIAPNALVANDNLVVFTDLDGSVQKLDFKKYEASIKKSLYFNVLKEMFNLKEDLFTKFLPDAIESLFTGLKFEAQSGSPYGFFYKKFTNYAVASDKSKYLDIYVREDAIDTYLTTPAEKAEYRRKYNEMIVSCTGATFGNIFALTHFLRLANVKYGEDDTFQSLYPSKVIEVKENKDEKPIELNFANILLTKFIPTQTSSNSIKKYFKYISNYHTSKSPIYKLYHIKGLPEFVQSGTISLPIGKGWTIYYDEDAKSIATYHSSDKEKKYTVSKARLDSCKDLNVSSSDNDYCVNVYDIIKIADTDIDSMLDGLAMILPNKIDKIVNVNPLYIYVILKNIKYPTTYVKSGNKTIEKYVENADTVKNSHPKLKAISEGNDDQKHAFDYIIKAAKYINDYYPSILRPRELRDSQSKDSKSDKTGVKSVQSVQSRIKSYASFIERAFSNKALLNPLLNRRISTAVVAPTLIRPPVRPLVAPIFGGGDKYITEQLIDYHFNNLRDQLTSIRKIERNAPLNGNLIPILQPDLTNMIHGGDDDDINNNDIIVKPDYYDNEMIKNDSLILFNIYNNAIEDIKRRLDAKGITLSQDTKNKLTQNLDALKKVEEYTIFYKNQLLRYQLQISQVDEQQVEVDFDRINTIARQFYNTREKAMKIEGSIAKAISYMARIENNIAIKEGRESNIVIQPALE